MKRIYESVDEIKGRNIAFLDLGGTLVTKEGDLKSTQKYVSQKLGADPKEEEEIYRNWSYWRSGIGDHLRHASDVTRSIKENKPKDQDDLDKYIRAIEEIVNNTTKVEEADEMVSILNDNCYETVILTSAPLDLGLYYASEFDVDGIYNWKDYVFDRNKFDSIYVNPEGRTGKGQIVHKAQRKGKKVMHIGDGNNDKVAVKLADRGWLRNQNDISQFYQEVMEEVKAQ